MSDDKQGGGGGGLVGKLVMLIIGLVVGGGGGVFLGSTNKQVQEQVKRAQEGELTFDKLKSDWEAGGWSAVSAEFEKQPDVGAQILLDTLVRNDEETLLKVRQRAGSSDAINRAEGTFLLGQLPEEVAEKPAEEPQSE